MAPRRGDVCKWQVDIKQATDENVQMYVNCELGKNHRYPLSPNINILPTNIHKSYIHKQRRRREEMRMDVCYSSCQSVFLRSGEGEDVFDFVKGHYVMLCFLDGFLRFLWIEQR